MPLDDKETCIDSHEVEEYLQKNEDELYDLLVPEHLKQQLFFEGNITAFGKSIFLKKGREIHKIVCQQYQCHKKDLKGMVELGLFVANTLKNLPQLYGINVLAMSILIVKIGLERWCGNLE